MQPLLIGPYNLGVQQNLKPFMLPEAAFPEMLNAFIWRGRVEKKAGYVLLGRLRRILTTAASTAGFITAGGAGTFSFNLFTGLNLLATQANAQFQSGNNTPIAIVIGAQTLTDVIGTGTMTVVGAGPITAAYLNYASGVLTIMFSGALAPTTFTFTGAYFPTLPAMGIRTREIPNSDNDEQTIFFDTRYAYRYAAGFQELPSTLVTTWSGSDSQQFWTTNFQNDALHNQLFWATNGVNGLHQYAVTAFAGAAPGPPSTVNVTAAGNTFQLGDLVFFNNLMVGAVPGANNAKFGIVTVPGNPTFTISNPATNYFVNEVVNPGMALTPNSNISGDGIRYYNGSTWANFNPILHIPVVVAGTLFPGENLIAGLILVPYKGRLVVLNTTEGNSGSTPVNYAQRARWSQNGTVLDFANGWRDDIGGRGGFEDAATEEQIISAGFVKDELIVYFERSTWKLAYTGNEIGPFIWQRINSELGAESTFSITQFDDGLIGFGNVGIHKASGSTVARIDNDIPDEVFNAHNNVDGPLRTSSIRDFYQEIVYFSYADQLLNTPTTAGKIFFPNKMVIYNYRNDTFSFFDDNATTLGYFQRINDTPWSQLTAPFTWAAWNTPWNSGVLQAQFPNIAFGNQQGFIEVVEPYFTSNAPSLIIQNIVGSTITSPQHNLFVGQYVQPTLALGVTGINNQTFQVLTVIDANNFTIDGTAVGTYLGNGVLEVPSLLNIQTKAFTPFWTKGKRYDLKYIDMLFDRTSQGELAVDIFVDFTDNNTMTSTASGVVLGNPVVSTAAEATNLPYYSFQSQGSQIWKRFYTVATGETFQVRLSFNDTEMRTEVQNSADVVLHAMIFHFDESGAFY